MNNFGLNNYHSLSYDTVETVKHYYFKGLHKKIVDHEELFLSAFLISYLSNCANKNFLYDPILGEESKINESQNDLRFKILAYPYSGSFKFSGQSKIIEDVVKTIESIRRIFVARMATNSETTLYWIYSLGGNYQRESTELTKGYFDLKNDEMSKSISYRLIKESFRMLSDISGSSYQLESTKVYSEKQSGKLKKLRADVMTMVNHNQAILKGLMNARQAIKFARESIVVHKDSSPSKAMSKLNEELKLVNKKNSQLIDVEYFREISDLALKHKIGSEFHLLAVAYDYLRSKAHKPLVDLVSIKPYATRFLVIGRNFDSDIKKPATWGNKAVVCDPVSGNSFSSFEIFQRFIGLAKKNRVKNGEIFLQLSDIGSCFSYRSVMRHVYSTAKENRSQLVRQQLNRRINYCMEASLEIDNDFIIRSLEDYLRIKYNKKKQADFV